MNWNAPDILRTIDRTPSLPPDLAAMPAAGTGKRDTVAGSFEGILKGKTIAASRGGGRDGGELGLKSVAEKDGEEETQRRTQAEKAAGDLVSNALILPMLKQLRRSPWAQNTPFSPGNGEKAFGPEFDIQISDRIAHSPRLGIKTALADRLMKRGNAHAAIHYASKLPPAGPGATRGATGKLNLHG